MVKMVSMAKTECLGQRVHKVSLDLQALQVLLVASDLRAYQATMGQTETTVRLDQLVLRGRLVLQGPTGQSGRLDSRVSRVLLCQDLKATKGLWGTRESQDLQDHKA
jgi:hypothetical protein